MAYALDIVVIILSVVAAAFFSGAETALTAASRARMHALETAGDKRAKLVTRLIGMRGRLISAMLLGGQLVTIGSSAIATSVLLQVLGERGVWAATAIMTALIVVFGEVMPKTIAIAHPDRVSLVIAPLVLFFVRIFGSDRQRGRMPWCAASCDCAAFRSSISTPAFPAMRSSWARSISCIARAKSSATSATCLAVSWSCRRSRCRT